MGAPSDDQIDECIADGLARGLSQAAILRRLMTLERMTDEELAAVITVPCAAVGNASPASPSAGGVPRARRP